MAENILEQHGLAMLLQKREKLSDIIISQTLSVMSIVAVSVCPVIIICGPEDYLLLYIIGIFLGLNFVLVLVKKIFLNGKGVPHCRLLPCIRSGSLVQKYD